MANFARTQIDAVWVTGYQPPVTDFEDLDRKCFQGVNGVVGGVYSPTAEIIVVGGGFGLRVTGPLDIRASGKLRFTTGATLTLADSDYQDLAAGHPGRTRTIYQAMAPVRAIGRKQLDLFAWTNLLPSGAVQALASSIRRADAQTTPEFLKELRVHDGAKLARVRLRFKVPTPHASVPQKMPRVRLFRVNNNDGTTSDLVSTAAGDGFVYVTTPTSGGAWHNNGAVQEFVITCDQNHTIDDDTYAYFAHVVEEQAGIPDYPFTLDVFESVAITTASTAANAKDGTCDSGGIVWPINTVCLFKDEVDKRYNGVWVAPGGPGNWTRHATLNASSQFKNGMLFETVAGVSGFANHLTVWQMTTPQPFVLDSSNISIGTPVPTGTIFLGMVLEYEGITSTKFQ